MLLLILCNSPNFLRPCDQGKRQLKDMKFWNWGPTIIWHNLGCIAFYFSKSLHPTVYPMTQPWHTHTFLHSVTYCIVYTPWHNYATFCGVFPMLTNAPPVCIYPSCDIFPMTHTHLPTFCDIFSMKHAHIATFCDILYTPWHKIAIFWVVFPMWPMRPVYTYTPVASYLKLPHNKNVKYCCSWQAFLLEFINTVSLSPNKMYIFLVIDFLLVAKI